jgi:hypothetical protein
LSVVFDAEMRSFILLVFNLLFLKDWYPKKVTRHKIVSMFVGDQSL